MTGRALGSFLIAGCGSAPATNVEAPPASGAGEAAHAEAPSMAVPMRFDFVAPDAQNAWRWLVLVYGGSTLDTGLGGAHCVHDAWRECTHDPMRVRLRASCVGPDATGPEAEVVLEESGRCALHAREIDADHASRGVSPEWTRVGDVPCPPPGSPCPHL